VAYMMMVFPLALVANSAIAYRFLWKVYDRGGSTDLEAAARAVRATRRSRTARTNEDEFV